MGIIATTKSTNKYACLNRVMDSAWFGHPVTDREKPPDLLNAEYVSAVTAAGTSVVNLIGLDSSNRVSLPTKVYPKAAGAIDFGQCAPSTETTGSLITTGTQWITVTAAGGCAVKLLCAYSATSGDYATLRIRARSDYASGSANGVVCGNFSASASVNDFANLYAVQGYAQPNAYTQAGGGSIVCGVYSCIDATGTSSGRRWSLWTDDHSSTKASGGHYLHRLSHNPIPSTSAGSDGVWSIYAPYATYLMNVEIASAFYVSTGSGGTAAGYLIVNTPDGAKRINLTTA